jgi:hypothetical protein
MTETQYRAEIRKVIADAARIGVGVLKAPTPRAKRVMAVTEAKGGGVDLQIKEKIIPAALWVGRSVEHLSGPGVRREHPRRRFRV